MAVTTPDDSTWDTDGDGLSDFWEIYNGFDPEQTDSDGDTLHDYWEAFHNTDPHAADSDYDGLTDAEEVFHPNTLNAYDNTVGTIWNGGWHIVYDYDNGTPQSTWVESDPLDTNTDADEILDNFERIYGYNPNAQNTLNIFNMIDRNYGVVGRDTPNPRPGDTVTYTVGIQNALDTTRRIRGLAEAEMPVDVVQETQIFNLLGQESVTMDGQAVVPGGNSAETTLTLRAGGIIEDIGNGRRLLLHLNELEGTTFADSSDAAITHNATCLNDCPIIQGGYLYFDGNNDALQVADADDLDMATFSIGMWVFPFCGNSGYRTLLTKGADISSPYQLRINDSNRLEGLVLSDDCSVLRQATSNTSMEINQWQHVMMTFDGFNIRIYQNGFEVGPARQMVSAPRPMRGSKSAEEQTAATSKASSTKSKSSPALSKAAKYSRRPTKAHSTSHLTKAPSVKRSPLPTSPATVTHSCRRIAPRTGKTLSAAGSKPNGLKGWSATPSTSGDAPGSVYNVGVVGSLGLEANNDAFTFSAWLKDGTPAQDWFNDKERLFSLHPNVSYPYSTNTKFNITFRSDGIHIRGDYTCPNRVINSEPFFDNQTDWHHMAVSVDPANDILTVYKNGALCRA